MIIELATNLTERRLGSLAANDRLRLIFWRGQEIADVFEGPPRWIIRQFNVQRNIQDDDVTAATVD
jgi:hypothetical protein